MQTYPTCPRATKCAPPPGRVWEVQMFYFTLILMFAHGGQLGGLFLDASGAPSIEVTSAFVASTYRFRSYRPAG